MVEHDMQILIEKGYLKLPKNDYINDNIESNSTKLHYQ